MVRTTNNHKRFAFTMIELIFAIVVIAISVMSLPMMTQVTQKGIESNILQEAIFAASAELMGASAGYWDENSMQDINVSHLSRVIDISDDCNTTTKLRPGHINQPKHRRCLHDMSTVANNGAGGAVHDLDDAEKITASVMFVLPGTDGTSAGYKELYKSVIDVRPLNTTGNNRNIKIITATITDEDDEPVTVLKMQSANVGEIDYYSREF